MYELKTSDGKIFMTVRPTDKVSETKNAKKVERPKPWATEKTKERKVKRTDNKPVPIPPAKEEVAPVFEVQEGE